jgi:hypothetical protein
MIQALHQSHRRFFEWPLVPEEQDLLFFVRKHTCLAYLLKTM